MASCRIDLENADGNAQGMQFFGSSPGIEVQKTMPAPLAGVMHEGSYKIFAHSVSEAIAEPVAKIHSQSQMTGKIFGTMIVTFFIGFVSGPISAMTGTEEQLMPLFFLPFIVWPPSFMLIFYMSCRGATLQQEMATLLREELEKQSARNPGVSFHLREETIMVQGHKNRRSYTNFYIEAQFVPVGGVVCAGSGIPTTNGYAMVAGSPNIPDRMANLDALKQRMLISDEEYQAKRKELLNMV